MYQSVSTLLPTVQVRFGTGAEVRVRARLLGPTRRLRVARPTARSGLPGVALHAAALMALGALVSCRPPPVQSGGMLVHERYWDPVVAELTYRASLDLQCRAISGPSPVRLTLLAKQGHIPTRVAADACGRTGLYSRVLRRHHGKYTDANSTWTLEASSVPPAVTRVVVPAAQPVPAEALPDPAAP